MYKMANMQNIGYWEALLENPPEQYGVWFDLERDTLREVITKDFRVLEIGCGDGRSLMDIIDITTDLVGIDNTEKAVEDGKKKFESYPPVKILLADAINLPFENESFDFVICMTTFANFGDKKYKALDEIKRVLKSTGKIIISVYGENALKDRLTMYKKMGQELRSVNENSGKVVFEEDWEDNVSEQFSEKDLREIFNKSKLNIIKIEKAGIGSVSVLKK